MAPKVARKKGELSDGRFWFEQKRELITLGVTSVGIEQIGAIQSVELPQEGEEYAEGEVIATVDGTNARLDVLTPKSGVVIEVNPAIGEEPDIVSEDPHEEGWLVKIEVAESSEDEESDSEEL